METPGLKMVLDNKVILIIATNIDDDDFRMLFENLEFKDKILLMTDTFSVTGYKGSINYLTDEFVNPEKSAKTIINWEKKTGNKIMGIIGLDEEYHYSFSYKIANILGLNYYDQEVLDSTSNKYLQLMKLKEANITHPEFEIVSIDNLKTKILFPNVTKIITGYASEYVYVNNNIIEFKNNFKEIRNLLIKEKDPMIRIHKFKLADKFINIDPTKEFLVQRLILGKEYSCDYQILDDGKVRILRVVEKIKFPNKFPSFKGFYLFNPDNTPECHFKLNDLKDFCAKVAKALDIKSGVNMVDFFFENEQMCLIETSVRPGISTFVELMSELYGTTSINILHKQKLGLEEQFKIPDKTGLAVYLSFSKKGVLKVFNTDKIKEIFNDRIINIYKFYTEGDKITLKNNNIRLAGYVLIKDVSYNQINSYIDKIDKAVQVNID